MKKFCVVLCALFFATACVPAKKYNELLEKEQKCSQELETYKKSSLDYMGKANELESRMAILNKELDALKSDTGRIGHEFRILQIQYDKMTQQNVALEETFERFKKAGAKETASLQSELEAKNLELQRKENDLLALEAELKTKQELLAEREQRVNELEDAIKRKDEATQQLKAKVAAALRGFENQGLSVVQKNGKIYVSMEAKLLFASGSTVVEANGKKALAELAKVLESEKQLEIVVEGHTDTDKLSSASHPTSNWELSVLRATSVVDIMLTSSKINPAQLMAAGRSEFHPVDPKDKAKNRRIEIIISPDLEELFEIISN